MDNRALRLGLRFLRGYAIAMSLIAATFLLGIVQGHANASFDSIDVHLINVRDTNGNLRLALFGKDWEPQAMMDGKPFGERDGGPRRDAGLMFYNDERDEIGGLIYGVHDLGNHVKEQGQSLTFDAYRQDQALQLYHDQTGSSREAGLLINDQPLESLAQTDPLLQKLDKLPPEQQESFRLKLDREGVIYHKRLFVGLDASKASMLSLRDGDGRVRLRLSVQADGTSSIEFLDATGKVTRDVHG